MTNADRWLVARYCGWDARKCDEPGCCCDQFWLYCGQMVVNEDAWWDDMPSADDLARHLPAFDTDPAQVVTMLEAMKADGRGPRLETTEGGWCSRIGMRVMAEEPTIPAAVFAACLACAKEKFGDQ